LKKWRSPTLRGGRAELSLTHDLNTVHISTMADRALLLKLAEEVGLTEAGREKFMGAATLLASEFVKDNHDCIDSVADELTQRAPRRQAHQGDRPRDDFGTEGHRETVHTQRDARRR
jgi:hypothetical protein